MDELGRTFSKRRSRGSSVSMSGCRLDGRASGVRFPAEAGDLCSSLCVQTSSEAHPASYPGPYRGGVTPTKHAHLVSRSRITRSYTPLPLVPCMSVARQLYCLACMWQMTNTKFYLGNQRRHRPNGKSRGRCKLRTETRMGLKPTDAFVGSAFALSNASSSTCATILQSW
jgi:hypothetical protein